MLYFACPSLGISHFSKEPWFLLVENGILEAKVWIPGMLIDAGQTELGNICTYINICVCIHTRTYIHAFQHLHDYFCICFCIENHGFTLTPILTFIFTLCFSLFVIPFFGTEKPASHYSQCIYLFDQSPVCNPFPPFPHLYTHTHPKNILTLCGL